MPSATVVANFGTIGITSNNENTADIKNMEEIISDNSDSSEYTEVAIEKTNTDTIGVLLTRGIIYVDDDADPGWYNETQVKTIQEGVDNASADDTVYVYNGTYYEHVTVNKTVDLIGENRDNVIVDGSGSGNVFHIVVSNVNVTSFTMTNGQYGIYVDYSPNCTFTDCRAIDNNGLSEEMATYYGFYARYSDFTSIIGGDYSRNGNAEIGGHGYNIYIYHSDSVTIDNVTVDDPLQGEEASCSFIYTWNGNEFEFISEIDLGKLGHYAYEAGGLERAKWENDPFYKTPIAPLHVDFYQGIESSQIQPLDGKYEIRYTEELDETSYADLLELWTIDHAPGVEVHPDWTYREGFYTVTNVVPPISAVDYNGDDVLSLISEKDWTAWANEWAPMEEDYINMTVDEVLESYSGTYITLKLGDWDETPENLKLVITENTEKGKNLEIRQQWKDMMKFFKKDKDVSKFQHIYFGPVIQINESGVWTDIPLEHQRVTIPTINDVARFMVTMDMPRTRVLDLTGLEIPNNEIRYVFNRPDRKCHVDWIGVDTSPPQEVDITVLKPSYANLGYRGSTLRGMQLLSRSQTEYTYKYTYSEELFDINYNDVIETTPRQSGSLTRYGDVLPLIQSINDEYVILAKGDEMSLQFDYTAPEDGMERDFIFREFGYYKTNKRPYGLTVEQLPFKDMTTYPYDEAIEQYDYDNHTDYIKNYQTRHLNGHNTACGLMLYYSDNFMLSNVSGHPTNDWEDYEVGIQISRSNDGTVTNINNLTGGWQRGLYIEWSSNINLTNLDMYDFSPDSGSISVYRSSNINFADSDMHDYQSSGISASSSSINVINCNFYNNRRGITLSFSSNCNIIDSYIYNNSGTGIEIKYPSDNPNNVTNCDIYNNKLGIEIYKTQNNNITNSRIYNNNRGFDIKSGGLGSSFTTISNCDIYNNSEVSIDLWHSSDNYFTNCDIYNNTMGIYFYRSSNNRLRDIAFYDNTYSFGLDGIEISHFYQDIDPSNTISVPQSRNGKPIYYLVEQENITLNETHNFGFLGLISCTNITAKNSDVYGILLANTTNSAISNVSSHNSGNGIYLWLCSDINFTNCDIYNNSGEGIYIRSSSNCDFTNCDIYNNGNRGIEFSSSPNNNFANCNIYNNEYGIYCMSSSNNNLRDTSIYDNTYEFYVSGSSISHYYQDIDTSNTVNGKPIYYLIGQENITLNATQIGFLGLISCTNIT